MAFADELRRLLDARGWRYVDIVARYPAAAKLAGVPDYSGPPHKVTFSGWLHGKIPGPYHRQILAAIFDVPVSHLLDSRPGHVESRPVERRDFVRLGAGFLAGATTADWERLGKLSGLNGGVLDVLEGITAGLVAQERIRPPEEVWPAAEGHLRTLADTVEWAPSQLGRRARSLAAQHAALLGYLGWKQGNNQAADWAWHRGQRWATEAGDETTLGLILILLAWRTEEDPQGQRQALELVDHAATLSLDPETATLVHAWRGSMHAPHDPRLARQCMDLAERCLAQAQKREVLMIENLSGELEHSRAQVGLKLRDYNAARADIDSLLDRDDLSTSWRADGWVDRMCILGAAGDVDGACAAGLASLALARQAQALHCESRLARKLSLWLPPSTALRPLRDALSV